MNCTYQELYFSNDGYVMYCKKCMHYLVAFGTVQLHFTNQEYWNFSESLRKAMHTTVLPEKLNCKCIVLRTLSSKVKIMLSYKELELLNNMIDQADTEIKIQELISCFHPKGY